MKDLTGNSKTTFTVLGASNHSDYERAEHDLTGCVAYNKKSSAACYAWFIWEKGYAGKPEIVWINK